MKSLLMTFVLLACLGPPPSQLRWADFRSWGDADSPRTQAFFSPDGSTVLTSLYSLNLWDTQSGKLLTHFPESLKSQSRDTYQVVEFLSDGTRLLTRGMQSTRAGGNGRPAKIWDLETGTLLGTFEAPDSLPIAHALTSDEKELWFYSLPREPSDSRAVSFQEVEGPVFIPQLELWDVSKRTRKKVWKLPNRERLVALNSQFLVTLQGNPNNRFRSSLEQPASALKVWDLRSKEPQPVNVLKRILRLDTQAVAFSPNGRHLLFEHLLGTDVLDLSNLECTQTHAREETLAWTVDDKGKPARLTRDTLELTDSTATHTFEDTACWAKINQSGHLVRKVSSALQIHSAKGILLRQLGEVNFLDLSEDARFIATINSKGKISISNLSKSVNPSILIQSKMKTSQES